MFSRGLKYWGDKEWLGPRVDKWVAQCQGYTRLRSRRLSRGCQTMLDRPQPFWSRSDSELINDLVADQPHPTSIDNVNISSLSLNENNNEPESISFSEKAQQYDQDVADYIAYLNKPIINMNDHYIEIHQYHYEPNNLIGGRAPLEMPVRPPTRRKKHKIDMKKTEIVDTKGISTITSPEYREFLVKRSPDCNQNIRIVSSRSSDEENNNPKERLDQHRVLTQRTAERGVDTVVSKEGQVKVKRGQTFTSSARSPAMPEPPPRGFLSFRTNKKNKSGRRKKRVVVGEAGMEGPIWPAVLLTFDRSLSPAPPESPDESEV